jgi:GntR family transcriptional regulator, transcriptional repressor for pyruvate dehydrogenase complex
MLRAVRARAMTFFTKAERLMREHMTEYAKFVEKRHPSLLDEVVSWL